MLRHRLNSTAQRPRGVVASAAIAGSVAVLVMSAPPAAAAAGWSRNPSASLAKGSVRVASSATTLCQWLEPATPRSPATSATTAPRTTALHAPTGAPGGSPIVFDGTRVELRLEGTGRTIPLGQIEVSPGGAWAGNITVPDTTVALPGDYQLLARCVIDRPDLDGVRSFDFDPLLFTIADAPPPTTVTVPTEIIPPITVTNPVEVRGAQLARGAIAADATTATKPTTVATLPNTGDGTVGVALAGLGSLLLGAGALWWGSRQTLRLGQIPGRPESIPRDR